MTPKLIMASGRIFEFPMFDPIVADRINSESANVGTLIHQIETEKIYAPLFEGKSNLTFLDIGANIGLVSLYAADACKRIVALEPAPDTYKVLKAMTHKFPQIEIAEFALAPVDGEVVFYENDINSTASSTVNTYGQQIKVQGLKLSSIFRIFQLESVDVCKIDAEGAEGESLTTLELEMAAPIVKSYYIETHNCPATEWQYKLGVLVNRLVMLGYYKQQINGMTLTASLP